MYIYFFLLKLNSHSIVADQELIIQIIFIQGWTHYGNALLSYFGT
jgi:hypothetical protein